MKNRILTQVVEPTSTGRCDVLACRLTGFSRSAVRGLFDHGCVCVNGETCTELATMLRAGDTLSIQYDPNRGYRAKKAAWDDRAFSIEYEDSQLLVVNKAAGVLTVPTAKGEVHTLAGRLSAYLSRSGRKKEAIIVHRLDREVSGLLVIAKSESVAQTLIAQFMERKPQRFYAAIVAGVMAEEAGTYQTHLGTRKNLDRYSTTPSSETELAVTHFTIQERLGDTTLIEVRLETGRRHQIRVHLAEAGHPLLGDSRYGIPSSQHPHWSSRRIALHARSLSIAHPQTGKELSFNTPLPIEMQKFLSAARRRRDKPQP